MSKHLIPIRLSHLLAQSEEAGIRITVLDAFSSRGRDNRSVGFAQIENFKGLESSSIWLVDMDAPSAESSQRASHYVGMTRARALLGMINIDSRGKQLKCQAGRLSA